MNTPSKKVDNIVNHITEVANQSETEFTYNSGVNKGALLMLAYLMKFGYITPEFISSLESEEE